jgi:hypothetical protein
MATLTITIPDDGRDIIADTIKKLGVNILSTDAEEDLTEAEFELLQESYKEALLIKKGIPASEL